MCPSRHRAVSTVPERTEALLSAVMARVLPGGPSTRSAESAARIGLSTVSVSGRERRIGLLTDGLDYIDSLAAKKWERGFLNCNEAEQDSVLRLLENTPHATIQQFWRLVIKLTLVGVFASQRHG
jgi:Gluconate 2-dehydrogenase subunit 3